MLSIILPTITGRSKDLKRCKASYERTLDGVEYEFVIVRNKPNWSIACNLGAKKAKGDVLHFTADDIEALPGWHVDALKHLEETDELPAALVWNHSDFGDPDNLDDGVDGDPVWFTRVPILRRDQYDRIGPWPELDYNSDIWLSERGRVLGMETRLIGSYRFVHHWSQVGRIDSPERLKVAYAQLLELKAAGFQATT